jgi:hypothetical protein
MLGSIASLTSNPGENQQSLPLLPNPNPLQTSAAALARRVRQLTSHDPGHDLAEFPGFNFLHRDSNLAPRGCELRAAAHTAVRQAAFFKFALL